MTIRTPYWWVFAPIFLALFFLLRWVFLAVFG